MRKKSLSGRITKQMSSDLKMYDFSLQLNDIDDRKFVIADDMSMKYQMIPRGMMAKLIIIPLMTIALVKTKKTMLKVQ